MMSAPPTYLATSPAATVDTISFGMPTGSTRMPAVASVVPPEPPAEMTPPMRGSRSIQRAKASAIAATEPPRSSDMTADAPRACMPATCMAGTSALDGFPEVDRSTVRTGNAQRLQPIGDEAQFLALGVEGADDQHGSSDALGEGDREDFLQVVLWRCLLDRRLPHDGDRHVPAVRQFGHRTVDAVLRCWIGGSAAQSARCGRLPPVVPSPVPRRQA